MMRSQPGAARQQNVLRVSVFGLPHGSLGRVCSGGLAVNAFHRARYGAGAADASPLSVPLYVLGAAQPPPPGKSQTLIS